MGLFNDLKKVATNVVKSEATSKVNSAVAGATAGATGAIGKGKNQTVSFTFNSLPTNVAELKALPEFSMDTAFKTTALVMAVLCNFEKNPEETFAMLDELKGPDNISTYEKQFIKERLDGKIYKVFSHFDGATVENNYTPSTPYVIKVMENPYSFNEENWATMFVKSAGADSERQIKLRKKTSTGQWFLTEIQCLADIRVPVAADPWA